MYYEKLIKDLHENNTIDKCLSSIINPLSLYYLCDHYYGNEIEIHFELHKIPTNINKNDLHLLTFQMPKLFRN
jgi:hypothetical protein